MRAYLFYGRGCSDVGALVDWQANDAARHKTERDRLLRRVQVLCTEAFPMALLRQERTAACMGTGQLADGPLGQYVAFFDHLRGATADHSSLLKNWCLTSRLGEQSAAPA
jgi:hypothetical protein